MSNKDKEEQKKEQEKKEEKEQIVCPLGKLFAEFCPPRNSKFFEHLNKSRVELLKAIRSIIDEKIERLEKRASSPKKKITKIEVE